MEKVIVTLDIGGTTFSSALFNQGLGRIGQSELGLIANFSNKENLIAGFQSQLEILLKENNLSLKDVKGLGISAPGPLESGKGMILETPNLIFLQNTNICNDMENRLKIPVFLENDANLFSWGEWQESWPNEQVMVGVTLGSGLGFGVIINGSLFRGAHGMAAEYGISPVEWGAWEDEVSIEGIENLSRNLLGEHKSPVEVSSLAESGNINALTVWQEFGTKLGLVLSHAVNLLDPGVVSIGGGMSSAFPFFKSAMGEVLKKYSPSFSYNNIKVIESVNKVDSAHLGAALLVQENTHIK